jgi:serine protease Do
MKRKRRIIILFIIVAIFIFITLFLPSIKSFINQSMNKEFIQRVNEYALSANIMIVHIEYNNHENISFSVSAGSSGVIIGREGDKYYALTEEHVISEIEDKDNAEIVVLGFDELDFNDHLREGGKFQGVESYYQQFPRAAIEYANEKYDLAIISFDSPKDYTVLSISEETPEYGDVVASMSNPYPERNIVTAGKVSTLKPRPFGDKAGEMQYPIIRHTAMISEGSSGSALLNENLEIVGINLGGGENIFRKFVHGMAMPSDLIRDFLEEWEDKAD